MDRDALSDHAFHQIHGVVMATMLDTADWFTAAPHFENWIATVEFQTRLLEPMEKVDLIAAGSFTATSVPAKW